MRGIAISIFIEMYFKIIAVKADYKQKNVKLCIEIMKNYLKNCTEKCIQYNMGGRL